MSAGSSAAARHQPALARFCAVALAFTALVLFAGGSTTSIEAGMAFLDWPFSNGSLNPEGWLDDRHMLAEHSHRLLAGLVMLLAVAAAVWMRFSESRAWVRRTAVVLVLTILLQALLGGARVLFDRLNTGADHNLVAQTFAVLHAAGAQITLCLWVTLVAAESRAWNVRGLGAEPVPAAVRRWGVAAIVLLSLQILIGAVIRHGKYALTIPYFPFNGPDHALLPSVWSWGIAVNFAHRAGAVLATIALASLAHHIFHDPVARRHLGNGMLAVLLALVLQIALGAEIIWSFKGYLSSTAHLLVGAFLLAATWRVVFLAHRSAWWSPDHGTGHAAPFSAPARKAAAVAATT